MADKDRLRPYVADGIEEYDNPMPRWWVGLFYATIVMAGVYLVRYHAFGDASLAAEYAAAARQETAAKAALVAANGGPAGLAQRLRSAAAVEAGAATFASNCTPCHGQHGEGTIGPNLTDEYWLHGGANEDIVRTITQGVADKGMPPWGPILGDQKIEQLAAFILSIQGSNPPNAKAPQGARFKRETI